MSSANFPGHPEVRKAKPESMMASNEVAGQQEDKLYAKVVTSKDFKLRANGDLLVDPGVRVCQLGRQNWLPPLLFWMVASCWWPGARLVQEALVWFRFSV